METLLDGYVVAKVSQLTLIPQHLCLIAEKPNSKMPDNYCFHEKTRVVMSMYRSAIYVKH